MASIPRVAAIYISPGHNFYGHYGQPAGEHRVISVPKIECIAGKGLIGDRYFDHKENYKGQITFFAWGTYGIFIFVSFVLTFKDTVDLVMRKLSSR